jgi:hypothetical protein
MRLMSRTDPSTVLPWVVTTSRVSGVMAASASAGFTEHSAKGRMVTRKGFGRSDSWSGLQLRGMVERSREDVAAGLFSSEKTLDKEV